MGQVLERLFTSLSAFLKHSLLSIEACGLQLLQSLGAGQSLGTLTILTFHRVLPDQLRREYAYPELAVTPQELSRILNWAKQHFAIDTVSRQVRKLGEKTSSQPLLAVTFDDGQFDNFLYALPVLNDQRILATFYLPVLPIEQRDLIWHDWLGFGLPYVGRHHSEELAKYWPNSLSPIDSNPASCIESLKSVPDEELMNLIDWIKRLFPEGLLPDWARPMSYEEVKGLVAQGHEVGSHAMSHRILTKLESSHAQQEIEQSKLRLESSTGVRVESFCYPNGNFNEEVERFCRDAGYRNATSTISGSNASKSMRAFALKRINVDTTRLVSPFGHFSLLRCKAYVFKHSLMTRTG